MRKPERNAIALDTEIARIDSLQIFWCGKPEINHVTIIKKNGVRERERETDRQTDRQTDRGGAIVRNIQVESERVTLPFFFVKRNDQY